MQQVSIMQLESAQTLLVPREVAALQRAGAQRRGARPARARRDGRPAPRWPGAATSSSTTARPMKRVPPRTIASALAADRAHRARRRPNPGSPTWCFSSLRQTASRTICLELVVGRSRAHRLAQVGLAHREEAGAELALGGQAHPVAVRAERLGHRVDEADLAARRRRTGRRGRSLRARARARRAGRSRSIIARSSSPVSTASGSQALSPSSGMNSMKRTWKSLAGELGERQRLLLGEAPHGDRVDLDRAEPRVGGERLEAAQHLRQRVAAGDRVEAVALRASRSRR